LIGIETKKKKEIKMENAENTVESVATMTAVVVEPAVTVVVTINQNDRHLTGEQLNINMDTPDRDILAGVMGIVREEANGADISSTYAVRKVLNTSTIYVYPKSSFG
jgi:hypothetical protein